MFVKTIGRHYCGTATSVTVKNAKISGLNSRHIGIVALKIEEMLEKKFKMTQKLMNRAASQKITEKLLESDNNRSSSDFLRLIKSPVCTLFFRSSLEERRAFVERKKPLDGHSIAFSASHPCCVMVRILAAAISSFSIVLPKTTF